MEIRSTEEARENVEDFAEKWLNLLLEKKSIDADIKALKQEAKENGVPVSVVGAAVARMKADMKKSPDEIFERDTISEWLETKATVKDKIGRLNE